MYGGSSDRSGDADHEAHGHGTGHVPSQIAPPRRRSGRSRGSLGRGSLRRDLGQDRLIRVRHGGSREELLGDIVARGNLVDVAGGAGLGGRG